MTHTHNIEAIAIEIIERHDAFLTELVIRQDMHTTVVDVYVDTDAGVSIATCSAISRELSTALDGLDIFAGAYRLDVSSPDLSRPIRIVRQYVKNMGRIISVTLSEVGTERTIEGVCEGADDAGVTIRLNTTTLMTIPLKAITQAFIVPQMKKRK